MGSSRIEIYTAITKAALVEILNRHIEEGNWQVIDTPHVYKDGDEWYAVLAYKPPD